MTVPRRNPSSHKRFAFPNMIITIAVTPAMTRPANKGAVRIRVLRRR